MARRRFFVDTIEGGRAELLGPFAVHLARVLRAEVGQQYEISDNQSAYLAEIETVTQNRVGFRILEQLPAEAPSGVTLAAALFKFDRFEWMLEKATELGVERIIPVATARSEKGLGRGAEMRLVRWRAILLASSQQSRRVRIPEIGMPEKAPGRPQPPVRIALLPRREARRTTARCRARREGGCHHDSGRTGRRLDGARAPASDRLRVDAGVARISGTTGGNGGNSRFGHSLGYRTNSTVTRFGIRPASCPISRSF